MAYQSGSHCNGRIGETLGYLSLETYAQEQLLFGLIMYRATRFHSFPYVSHMISSVSAFFHSLRRLENSFLFIRSRVTCWQLPTFFILSSIKY
jgi:hypothetical protein